MANVIVNNPTSIIRDEIVLNNVIVTTNDTQIDVTQPVVNVIEIATPGPMGPSGPQGPQGFSDIFTFVDNNTYATTSSLEVTGSIFVTGRLYGTASWAEYAITASYFSGSISNAIYAQTADTASYLNPLHQILFITGGLNIYNPTTENSLIITSGSTTVLTVTGSGVTVFGTLNNPETSPGGIYFDGIDFFLAT